MKNILSNNISLKKINLLVPIIIELKSNFEIIIVVSEKNLLFSLNCLKNHINFQYNLLSCISGVDYFENKYRFAVVYDLLSLNFNSRIRVKVFVDELTSVNSVIPIFKNANWWEREVWDMYGIYFKNHIDLRRILTDYGFEGYPMRKEFPLSGFIELSYNNNKKRIVLEQIELAQEFRSFVFEIPW
jgi:NADH/F420H2 dehydrogenase subunit C